MPRYGKIVVIKRNGTDGIVFPLTSTSCLFGRKTECDIRMRLPWVSNEHCKIEINENKEAILINLSTVNPTQLNGACFEQPVPLKHGDVLTIIDRSFRFEYPLESTPKKRRSKSPKDETLQVLHVQQVAEVELLHKQTSGSKSLDASDNAELEEKNANENKQTPEKKISEALPIKLQTPKSSHRIYQVIKKQNQMSPFTKLYENLKSEMKVEKPLHKGNGSQRAAKEDGGRVLPEPSANISSLSRVCDLGSLTKGKEIERSDNMEECKIVRREVNSSGFNQLSAGGSDPRRSFGKSPRTSVSKEVSRDTGQRPLQDPKELGTPGRSRGTAVTPKSSKQNHGNFLFSQKQCSIESLDYPDKGTVSSSTTNTPCVPQVDKYVLSTPTPRRKSPRSLFVSPTNETTGMNPTNTDTPRTPRRASLKPKRVSEIPAETPREDSVCGTDTLQQLPFPENKGLKQRRNSKQHTPGKPVQEVLKEICGQANLDNSKVGQSETPASFSNSKSPRRKSRQSKEFSDKSVHSETLASEEIMASPANQKPGSGRKRGRPRTSGLLTERALESNAVQEHHGKAADTKDSGTGAELAMEGHHQMQNLEDTTAIRPGRPAKRRSSGSAAELKDTEAVSDTGTWGLLDGEDSGKKKRISQKRKSGDILSQILGKRKRVSFGGHLSPELFDKSLPPNSPLKKGALPARRSLPYGNSPRAVLKKAQGLKRFANQEEKRSPKNLPAQNSPAASPPPSGKAAPTIPSGSPAPFRKGRFSISRLLTPFPIAEEQDAGAEDRNPKEESGVQGKTPKSSPADQDDKTFVTVTPAKFTRSAQLGLKGRGGAVAVLNAKRRSGASSANLLVAKSWAEVVKLGVARPQSKTAKRSVQKGRTLKRINHPPKTPEKKIKDDCSTGHAESPATIVVGRAYSTTIRSAGHVPKLVKNPILKLNMGMDESFTGVPEMFQTPEDQSGKALPLAVAWNADFTPTGPAGDISDLHTPEESGEMMVSPLNSSDASEQKQGSPGMFHFLREESSPSSIFDEISTKYPEKRSAVHEDNEDSSSIIPEIQASLVKSGSKRRTPKQKMEPVEVMSGKRKLLRTPEQRSEPGEALSGIKQLMRTPKQKTKAVEALSGIKQLMRTPNQELEPAEVLSGIKQLMKTPNQELEPAEVLSGIKQLMKTPNQELEPAEVLSGIKQLMKTPNQELEPAEVLSGIKQLMRTPRRKPEPVEDLSGIKELMRTPEQELEPVTDEIAFKRLLETPVQSRGAVKDVAGVTSIKKTPKLKYPPVEDMVGISRIFKTPKEKVEPVENMFGISRLMKSPREKYQPVDDFVGLQRLMAEPRQKSSDSEVDYVGVTEMFGTPEERKVRSVKVTDSQEGAAPPCSNSSHEYENKGQNSQGEGSQQKESTSEEPVQRLRKGRSRKAIPPAPAKPFEKEVNFKELQSPEPTCTQEGMGVITSANKGRGRRTRRCMQEVVSKHPDPEGLDTVSFVEPHGASQRPGRGKRKELKELKHPNENLESCIEDCSVLQEKNAKQSLQDCGINDVLEIEDDPATKTGSSDTQNETCQLQTGLNKPDSKSTDSGIEDGEEVLLSPRRRRRGAENTEPLVPAKRGRRARNDPVQQAAPAELHGTARKLRKDPSPEVLQRDERAFDKDPEAVAAQESENGTKLELRATEKRVKSFRSTRNRKHSAEIKAGTPGVALENTQNVQKSEETSTETDTETQSHMKNQMKVSQGCETENAQEIATEASRRLKAESPSGETNKVPVSALNLEANRSAGQQTNRTRNRRGKKDTLEQKADEVSEDVNNLKVTTPKFKLETEVDESSLKDSLGSVCGNAAQVRKEQESPAASSVPAADRHSLAHGRQKRTRNVQGILKAKQTEILQENPAQRNGMMSRRGRGKKVNFEPAETSSKAVEGRRGLPGDDEGMPDKDTQHGNSESPPSQVRRGRRRQVDSIPQIASPAFMEKQTLIADHSKDEAVVKEQESALEAAPSSAENPPRRGRRREVAAAPQTSRSPLSRRRCELLEGDDKKMAVREDENPALGNKTWQAKANAPAKDKRKKIDLAAEAKSSAPLQRKSGLLESDAKGGGTDEEQGVPLETVSCAEEKPLGRGRRKETALASHTAHSISLRGKRRLPAGDGGEEAPKEEQNVPLETCDSSGEGNQQRRGRRKEIALLMEAKSSVQGKPGLSKQSGRKNDREAKLSLDISPSQESRDLSKGNLRQAITSLAVSPASLQGLPEGDKNGIPEEQSKLSEVAPPAKRNPSRVGRKKTTSTPEETTSTSLREKPNLPKGRGQKRVLKESEDASPENNSCQGRTRQLRNKRRKVEFTLEAATSTSLHKNSDLPESGNTLETQDLCVPSTGSGDSQSGKGQEGDPAQKATSASRRRKCQLPAAVLAPNKLKSGNDENLSAQRGKRNKTKEELGQEDARAAQSSGGMDRRTRSSTRIRK